jgi:hypothetical protein
MRWMLAGFALLIGAFSGSGCDDCKDYEEVGVRLVRCDSLTLPAAINAGDTLRIGYFGWVPDASYSPKLSHIEVSREADSLELRIWAHARRWLGECGTVMPPSDDSVHGEHIEPPPWPGDSILVRLHRPEAPPVDRWVQVLH